MTFYLLCIAIYLFVGMIVVTIADWDYLLDEINQGNYFSTFIGWLGNSAMWIRDVISLAFDLLFNGSNYDGKGED